NYGTTAELRLNSNTNWAYLKFDLTGVPLASVSSATLRIYKYSTTTNTTVTAYQVTDDTWTETALNWSNKPAMGTAVNSVASGALKTWYEIDVTSFVNAQLAGDKVVSLGLNGSSSTACYFRSKENGANTDAELVILP